MGVGEERMKVSSFEDSIRCRQLMLPKEEWLTWKQHQILQKLCSFDYLECVEKNYKQCIDRSLSAPRQSPNMQLSISGFLYGLISAISTIRYHESHKFRTWYRGYISKPWRAASFVNTIAALLIVIQSAMIDDSSSVDRLDEAAVRDKILLHIVIAIPLWLVARWTTARGFSINWSQ